MVELYLLQPAVGGGGEEDINGVMFKKTNLPASKDKTSTEATSLGTLFSCELSACKDDMNMCSQDAPPPAA